MLPKHSLEERKRLEEEYRHEAISLGITSLLRQNEFICERLAGATTFRAHAVATVGPNKREGN